MISMITMFIITGIRISINMISIISFINVIVVSIDGIMFMIGMSLLVAELLCVTPMIQLEGAVLTSLDYNNS